MSWSLSRNHPGCGADYVIVFICQISKRTHVGLTDSGPLSTISIPSQDTRKFREAGDSGFPDAVRPFGKVVLDPLEDFLGCLFRSCSIRLESSTSPNFSTESYEHPPNLHRSGIVRLSENPSS